MLGDVGVCWVALVHVGWRWCSVCVEVCVQGVLPPTPGLQGCW